MPEPIPRQGRMSYVVLIASIPYDAIAFFFTYFISCLLFNLFGEEASPASWLKSLGSYCVDDLKNGFNDVVSSVIPPPGTTCTLFT